MEDPLDVVALSDVQALSGRRPIPYFSLPENEREELIQKIEYKTYNERTINSRENFRKCLKEVRTKGFAVDFAEEIDGMQNDDAAAPVTRFLARLFHHLPL